jgi:hypothetical protein
VIFFLSGGMTGMPEYNRPAFYVAEFILKQFGFEVKNPARLDETGKTYDDLLAESLELLKKCDAVYMLRGWENSKGANVEHQYAIDHDLAIYYQ